MQGNLALRNNTFGLFHSSQSSRTRSHVSYSKHRKTTVCLAEKLDYVPLVKMCGITNPKDASLAAEAGASFIGMILWPKAKRSVSLEVAREIAAAAREQGAEPVCVFVDENAVAIERVCEKTGVNYVQLHGEGARVALEGLDKSRKVIHVVQVGSDGLIQTPQPPTGMASRIEWTLVDSIQGGSGTSFDWSSFKAPESGAERGWLLAGGLNPDNVAQALSLLRPGGVDVCSGIAGPDGMLKDRERICSFMHAVQNWKQEVAQERLGSLQNLELFIEKENGLSFVWVLLLCPPSSPT